MLVCSGLNQHWIQARHQRDAATGKRRLLPSLPLMSSKGSIRWRMPLGRADQQEL